jgi:hypothetical protein
MKKEEYCDACNRVKSKCICKCGKCKKIKSECACPKEEAKECTDASSSGSYEAPMSGVIQKKDIHKLYNYKSKEIKEMDGIPGMAYDAPIGTKKKDPLALDEKGRTASITAASTDNMIATKKGFPRFGGPDAKFVEIDSKCKTYPYCNQGDSGTKLKFISEIHGMKAAIEYAAKKYGLPVEQVAEIVIKESMQISEQRAIFDDPGNIAAMKKQRRAMELLKGLETDDDATEYRITTMDPIDFKTPDKDMFEKFKHMLIAGHIKFQEEKNSIENKHNTEIKPPDDDDDIYGSDEDFDANDDIFANMKK